jgi:hypothetical protein
MMIIVARLTNRERGIVFSIGGLEQEDVSIELSELIQVQTAGSKEESRLYPRRE